MVQWTVVKKAFFEVDVKRQVYYHIRHLYRQIQRVKTWQLLIILMLGVFVAATFLRLNNIGMAQRREAVLFADKEARDEDITNRMYDLQRFTASHMNTDTGRFDLTEQYRRDVEDIIAKASNDTNPNGNVLALADAACAPRFSSWSPAYVQCVKEEQEKFPAAPEIDDSLDLPNPALYRHGFAAPLWSPDFAGFSVLFVVFVALIIIGRWVHFGFLHLLLKLRYRGIGS